MLEIRNTLESDEPAIHELHEKAFGSKEGRVIADLTLNLLHDPTATPLLSLLAWDDQVPVGHVLFTRVQISGWEEPLRAHILAPLAVLPGRQRDGVGTELVSKGLVLLTEAESELVFVLGHPSYYPRFGFQPAGRQGLSAPYVIPDKDSDAWMVQELRPSRIGTVRGTVQCATALNRPEHWRE